MYKLYGGEEDTKSFRTRLPIKSSAGERKRGHFDLFTDVTPGKSLAMSNDSAFELSVLILNNIIIIVIENRHFLRQIT